MKGCINLVIGITLLVIVLTWLSDNWTYVLVGLGIICTAYFLYRFLKKKEADEGEQNQWGETADKTNVRIKIHEPAPRNVLNPLPPANFRFPKAEHLEAFTGKCELRLLDNSTAIYLSDILSNISMIFQNIPGNLVDHPDTSFAITSKEQRILTDLKSIGNLLELEMEKESTERNILMAAFSYFLLPSEQYAELIDSKQRLNFLTTYYQSFRPQEAKDSDTIADLPEQALKEYFVRLKEIITLITTIDFVLTGKEKEVLDIFNPLTKDNFQRNIPVTKPFRF